MKRWQAAVGVLMVAIAFEGRAQRAPIETDRPDQTESTAITPAGHLQVEHGVALEREGGISLIAHPSTLARFGVTDRFEVRIVIEPVTMAADGAPTLRGVLPMEFGFKAALWKSHGGASALSVIGHLQMPHLASGAFRGSRIAPLVRLTAATPLGDEWKLGVNAGVEGDAGGGPTTAIYTCTAGAPVSASVGWYGEIYGSVPDDGTPADHRINSGVTWLISEDLQLDAAVGVGLSSAPAPWFVGVGVSYRFAVLGGR